MSAAIKGFTVALEPGIREEGARKLANAIRFFNGVLDVKTIEETPQDWITKTQVSMEYQRKLYEVLNTKL